MKLFFVLKKLDVLWPAAPFLPKFESPPLLRDLWLDAAFGALKFVALYWDDCYGPALPEGPPSGSLGMGMFFL